MQLTNNLKSLVVLLLGLALWKNVRMENTSDPLSLGLYETIFHSLLFLVRFVPKLLLQRLFGVFPNVATHTWFWFEELSMRVANFHAKIGHVSVPNSFLNLLAGQIHFALTKSKLAFVEVVDPVTLGFDLSSPNCTALWITLKDGMPFKSLSSETKVIFYTHGGGFCVGNAGMYLAAHWKCLRILKQQHGIENVGILSIEYPLAPGVKHPVPMESCFKCFDLLVPSKFKPHQVILAGDSAGGSIALSLALRATKWGVAGVCLFSPWVGHSLDTESHTEYENIDLIGGRLVIEQFQNAHVNGGKLQSLEDDSLDVFNKQVPFGASPQIWMSCGGFEVFKDDILRFAQQVESHEVKLTLSFGEACPHVYPLLYPLFQNQATLALEDCMRFCVERWAEANFETERLELAKNQEELLRVNKLKRDMSLTDVGEMFKHFW